MIRGVKYHAFVYTVIDLQGEDGEDLTEVERTAAKIRVVRKLVLHGGPSDFVTAVLHGVAASATIEDLKVHGKLAERACLVTMATALLYCFP